MIEKRLQELETELKKIGTAELIKSNISVPVNTQNFVYFSKDVSKYKYLRFLFYESENRTM